MQTELREFVRDALTRGMSRADIRQKLEGAGWQREEIDGALEAYAEIESPVPVPRRKPYLSAREAFFYLVLFVTLYIAAINVGTILFQLLNKLLPDVSQDAGMWDRFSFDTLRGAISGLVIAFPVYLLMSRLIGRAIRDDPEKAASKVRKWLTYLTLFVSACVIIADLTYLVGQYLSGELVLRAFLKVVVVLAIAGFVFVRYLSELKREEDRAELVTTRPNWLARAAGGATVAVLVAGFVLLGSPGVERNRRLDDVRVGHLQEIVTAVERHYRDHGALPDSLGSLQSSPSGPEVHLRDPETEAPYGYRIVDSTTYDLQAIFATVNTGERVGSRYNPNPEFWKHGEGVETFTIRIPSAVIERRVRSGAKPD